jgi:hypothetical protein
MPYTARMLWEALFLLVVLKIPIVYLVAVVWWAIRAEPEHPEGAAAPARLPSPDRPRRPRRIRFRGRPGPHGSPSRRPVRPLAGRAAAARARARRP